MRTVFAPHLARSVVIGGRQTKPRKMRMHFQHYVRKTGLPEPPAFCDYSGAAIAALRDVMGNDDAGNCVYAAGYHHVALVTGNAGNLFHATTDQVNADYSAVSGYVPGDPSTDVGADPKDAIDYWIGHGFANGTKAVARLALDPSNPKQIKQAVHLFEGAMIGGPLGRSWIDPFPERDGFVWDDAGDYDSRSGHEVCVFGYGPFGPNIDTWGLLGQMTWEAVAQFCSSWRGGDMFVILTPDIINKAQNKAPNGLDWAQLTADFNALGGSAPPPPAPLASELKMQVVPGVSGELVCDTYAVVRADTAARLKASGVAGVVRYLDNLTAGELQGLLAAGLKVGFVSSCRRTGWIPSKSMGQSDGASALARLRALAIPVGPHAQADCEGMGGTGQGLIDYLNGRGSVIKAAQYRHAEYEGWGHKTNPYASIDTNGYWAAMAIAEPRPACGWFMVQLMPGNQSRCGVVVDLNIVQQDSRGRVPYFVAAL